MINSSIYEHGNAKITRETGIVFSETGECIISLTPDNEDERIIISPGGLEVVSQSDYERLVKEIQDKKDGSEIKASELSFVPKPIESVTCKGKCLKVILRPRIKNHDFPA